MRHTINLRGLMIHFFTEHSDLSTQIFIKYIGNVAHNHLQELRVLQIRNMKHLKCFSYDFPNLICLQDVSIIGCETLEELPTAFGQLEALEAFQILGCPNLKRIHEGLQIMTHLKKLNFLGCEALEEFPLGVTLFKL